MHLLEQTHAAKVASLLEQHKHELASQKRLAEQVPSLGPASARGLLPRSRHAASAPARLGRLQRPLRPSSQERAGADRSAQQGVLLSDLAEKVHGAVTHMSRLQKDVASDRTTA